jgi:hypothetical protein
MITTCELQMIFSVLELHWEYSVITVMKHCVYLKKHLFVKTPIYRGNY